MVNEEMKYQVQEGKQSLRDCKVALTMLSGRPNVKKVVEAFLRNAELHGYDLNNFSVYLSIDLDYQNRSREEFYIDSEIIGRVNKIEYIFEEDRHSIGNHVAQKFGFDLQTSRKLFSGREYSKQRNCSLYCAARDLNDVAICVDDDEAPYIPVRKNGEGVEWKNLDFFSPHLSELMSGTEITRGPYIGYTSPVPSDFEKNVPEQVRINLGRALEWGNEVITRHSFLNLMSKISYLDEEEIGSPSRPFEVENSKNGKHIFNGNAGINLHSFRKGRIPLFYNPPSARGEDSIFALQIPHLKVKEVGSFIFHDPFELYHGIFAGEFPSSLRSIPVTEETKTRFSNALIGWLKYAPLLIYLTSKNEKERRRRIESMISEIEAPTANLASVLGREEINSCKQVLRNYYENVNLHLEDLRKIQDFWMSSEKKLFFDELNSAEILQ